MRCRFFGSITRSFPVAKKRVAQAPNYYSSSSTQTGGTRRPARERTRKRERQRQRDRTIEKEREKRKRQKATGKTNAIPFLPPIAFLPFYGFYHEHFYNTPYALMSSCTVAVACLSFRGLFPSGFISHAQPPSSVSLALLSPWQSLLKQAADDWCSYDTPGDPPCSRCERPSQQVEKYT